MKSRKTVWSEEELKRLAEFVVAGGSPVRASVRFGRTIASCRRQARKMGVPFEYSKTMRKNMLAKCAAAEREPFR
jgi:hypothetical protein